MNRTKHLIGKIGIALCSALIGCTAVGQPSVSVGVSVTLPSVEIRAESDFYEPLTPHGSWVVIGSYGRCWRPARVETGWRPYSDGYWQRTDAGWYWVSDEPWAWATYHYGRWNFEDDYGWYWVPHTHWAPAWVSWHSGGGYIGWAPLYPSGITVIAPRAYVFVQERQFTERVRRSTVVVNNTTIINKTVINEAPDIATIEKVSGRKVEAVPVRELRKKHEAAAGRKQRTPTEAGDKKIQPSPSGEAEPRGKKTETAPGSPEVKRPAADKQPAGPKADKHIEKQEKPDQPADRKAKPSAKSKPDVSEKKSENPEDKDKEHGNKPKK